MAVAGTRNGVGGGDFSGFQVLEMDGLVGDGCPNLRSGPSKSDL